MDYVINVSRKGHALTMTAPRHVFRTAVGSIQDLSEAFDICTELRQVYHADGYEISLSTVQTIGTSVKWEKGT